MNIPSTYLPVMPYLILERSAAFLAFSKTVFGATEQLIHYRDNDDGVVQHGEIRIHDAVIMFAEATENWGVKTAALFLYVDDVDAVFKRALANGGVSLEAPATKDYGYTGGFRDPFGNDWYIVQGEQS